MPQQTFFNSILPHGNQSFNMTDIYILIRRRNLGISPSPPPPLPPKPTLLTSIPPGLLHPTKTKLNNPRTSRNEDSRNSTPSDTEEFVASVGEDTDVVSEFVYFVRDF